MCALLAKLGSMDFLLELSCHVKKAYAGCRRPTLNFIIVIVLGLLHSNSEATSPHVVHVQIYVELFSMNLFVLHCLSLYYSM